MARCVRQWRNSHQKCPFQCIDGLPTLEENPFSRNTRQRLRVSVTNRRGGFQKRFSPVCRPASAMSASSGAQSPVRNRADREATPACHRALSSPDSLQATSLRRKHGASARAFANERMPGNRGTMYCFLLHTALHYNIESHC